LATRAIKPVRNDWFSYAFGQFLQDSRFRDSFSKITTPTNTPTSFFSPHFDADFRPPEAVSTWFFHTGMTG